MPFLGGFRGPADLRAAVLPETPKNENNDIQKLAQAVAIAETGDCTKGYGPTHNNCFGIKKGGTVPCQTLKNSKMCKFESKEESYEAFKTIWQKWYKNNPPTLANARTWTGDDNPQTWLENVKSNL